VLDNFGEYLPKFKKIIPHDYERVLKTIVQMEEKGLSAEQAQHVPGSWISVPTHHIWM